MSVWLQISIFIKVEDLTTQNKDLKDQNDELNLQLEAAKMLTER